MIFNSDRILLKNKKQLILIFPFFFPAASYANFGWYSQLASDGKVNIHNSIEFKSIEAWDKNKEEHKTSNEALGAIGVNLQSGFIGSRSFSVGFGLGGAYVYKISDRNPDTDYGATNLAQENCFSDPDRKGRLTDCDTVNSGKLSQMNIQLKVGKKKRKNLSANVGLGYFDAGMIQSYDPDDDLIPKSYTGFEINSRWDNTLISGAFVTGMIKGNAQSVQKLHYIADKEIPNSDLVYIDHVASIGLRHKLGATDYSLSYAYASGYKHRYLASAKYNMDLTSNSRLLIEAAYNLNQHKGRKWDEAIKKGIETEGEDIAYLTTARVRYDYSDDFRIGLGWSKTGGNTDFNPYLAGVDAEWLSHGQGSLELFRKLDNTSHKAEVVYWLNNLKTPLLKDLRLKYQYIWGTNNHVGVDKNMTGEANENIFEVLYTHPSGHFSGSTASLKVSKLSKDKAWGQVSDINGDPSDKGDVSQVKMTISFPIY
ncbi:hypothetical protein [Endozoicomonas elysicola]|uniref:Porin n=1 Tax=Endozoicomonas elysicola TaxID=305900 RepID=A0A081KFR0_9GAMM|nr:hypothetical protein [Endozoicomonas elysicola]KEI72986.1 hypothetical protein GV64_21705 [Endozoicomonas elysicola]